MVRLRTPASVDRRSSIWTMARLCRVPLRIGAEHLVCQLFLLLGHRVVEVVEGWNQLLELLGMRLGNLLPGWHVLHRIHGRVLLSALHKGLIHVAGVIAHDLGELIPLWLLGRGVICNCALSCLIWFSTCSSMPLPD